MRFHSAQADLRQTPYRHGLRRAPAVGHFVMADFRDRPQGKERPSVVIELVGKAHVVVAPLVNPHSPYADECDWFFDVKPYPFLQWYGEPEQRVQISGCISCAISACWAVARVPSGVQPALSPLDRAALREHISMLDGRALFYRLP